MHINLHNLEHYSDDKFILEGLYKSTQSEAVLLFLKPGQEMPAHPHERFEVTLLPRKGRAVLDIDGKKQVNLVPDCLYYEPAGRTFAIKNTGDEPFAMMITLIRVESPSATEASTES